MLSKELVSYINNPSRLNEETIIELTLISERYPFFQTAQLLRIKNLFNISPESIKPALNYTAAYVTDRKVLYYLLHPISAEPEKEVQKSIEKEVKDTIGENISDALKNQKDYLENNIDEEIEFTTGIDIKKEYGEGVKLDEYVVRISENGPELFELLEKQDSEEKQPDFNSDKPIKEEPQKETIHTNDDILTIINKGIPSEKIIEEQPINLSSSQQRNNSIIDNFIKANPKIKPADQISKQATDFSEDSVKENDHLITDTLANIYVKQGNYAKAIFAYEKLSLKYPEKSAYFAEQIEEIKKLIEKSK
jgi:hypothetical protein